MSEEESGRTRRAPQNEGFVYSEIDEFHRWLGMCISQWAQVDNWIFAICWKSLRTPRVDLAAVVYYQFRTLTAQIKLTSDLLQANLTGGNGRPTEALSEWQAINNRIVNKLLPVRNRLAHQPVAARLTPELDGFDVTIEAAFAETLRPRKGSVASLALADLQKHLIEVQQVIAALKAFDSRRLPAHPG